ncbi:hypothetical protein [Thermococcus sp. Bubb.Bath]|uniref:hypothetical protein n=1 Tax=Thermococcus sp. Bubb.Bath TaxID=1638242 RepID=UPI00143A425B|nr:hypothetical protein [Thermococcus sp. Bubb.Bath]NJF24609.1 hypothetical protein [Thermococcus sp. Bubb.Bath]
MRYSGMAVKILEGEEGEDVFYDPAYHGRTLKVFGMDGWTERVILPLMEQYKEKGYSLVVFDSGGNYPRNGFDTVLDVEDGKPMGLDPIKMAVKGAFDSYSAATIVETAYGLDTTLTDRLYADILEGKVKSMDDALKSKAKYAEVIAESYTPLDAALHSGEPPEIKGNALVNLGNTHSLTTAGNAFLVVAAAIEKRRKTVVVVDDAAVLAYGSSGSAAIPIITRPMRARAAILGTAYAVDSVMNLAGPTLVLYHDPDTQAVVYDANGVPPGDMRRHILKEEGAFIYRTPETINVEFGKLPEGKSKKIF